MIASYNDRIHITLDKKLIKTLRVISKEEHKTVSRIIREAVLTYLIDRECIQEIEKR